MKTYTKLYEEFCSLDNLVLALRKARKGKTQKKYVIEFERNQDQNLFQLQEELRRQTYKPLPLQTFIIHDPKTRKISRSAFRDRIVHHAICNIIEPLFDATFISDSYANRKGKGTLKAIEQYDTYKRKVSHNFTRQAYVFKADIYHYFEEVEHRVLLGIISQKIKDRKILCLIDAILSNYHSTAPEKGMPLGNLTSQFFANVYLNELDQYVKHTLRTEYYIRYVDDFVIVDSSKEKLEFYRQEINSFLLQSLHLRLHPQKSKIISVQRGITFLGFNIFPYHKLLKSKNLRKFRTKLKRLVQEYDEGEITYDAIYDFIEGWCAYARQANSYRVRNHIIAEIEQKFSQEISTKEVNRLLNDQPPQNASLPTPSPSPLLRSSD